MWLGGDTIIEIDTLGSFKTITIWASGQADCLKSHEQTEEGGWQVLPLSFTENQLTCSSPAF